MGWNRAGFGVAGPACPVRLAMPLPGRRFHRPTARSSDRTGRRPGTCHSRSRPGSCLPIRSAGCSPTRRHHWPERSDGWTRSCHPSASRPIRLQRPSLVVVLVAKAWPTGQVAPLPERAGSGGPVRPRSRRGFRGSPGSGHRSRASARTCPVDPPRWPRASRPAPPCAGLPGQAQQAVRRLVPKRRQQSRTRFPRVTRRNRWSSSRVPPICVRAANTPRDAGRRRLGGKV